MSDDMRRWRDRVALVTGASSGIGRATALALAREGLRVAACARRIERLEELRAEAAASGGTLLPVATDLRSEPAIHELFHTVRGEWGGVDVCVNNAGIGRRASLMEGETDEWRAMLEVNVLALCICTREALRDMRERGDDGHVIHVSSMAGHRVPPGAGGVYAATKHAVRALTESLRKELRAMESSIRVTSISPGLVETEFASRYLDDEEAARDLYGAIECLRPEDVAAEVLHVLSRPPHAQVHDVLLRPTDQEA